MQKMFRYIKYKRFSIIKLYENNFVNKNKFMIILFYNFYIVNN